MGYGEPNPLSNQSNSTVGFWFDLNELKGQDKFQLINHLSLLHYIPTMLDRK